MANSSSVGRFNALQVAEKLCASANELRSVGEATTLFYRELRRLSLIAPVTASGSVRSYDIYGGCRVRCVRCVHRVRSYLDTWVLLGTQLTWYA